MSPVWNYKALETSLLDPNGKPSGAELKALRASWAWQDAIARKEPWASHPPL